MPVETRLQRKRRLQAETVAPSKAPPPSPELPSCCPICLGCVHFWHRYITPCSHTFHRQCLADWLAINPTCPLCRVPLSPPPELSWPTCLALAGLLWWLC